MGEPLTLSRKIMGGIFTAQVWTNQTDRYTQIIQNGFDSLEELENKLTDFRDSPFNQINEKAGLEPAIVDNETFDLILLAQRFSEKTNGVFDISYASVGHLWRKARQAGQLPDDQTISEQSQWVDYKKIVLNKNEHSVFLPDPRMRIGLGGIGKGYAVDKLYQFLLDHGMVNFLIDGSGDIRVHSDSSAPRPWRLGLRNPFSEDRQKKIGTIQLKEGAIATSGDYINFIKNPSLERKYHHIIDARTGQPTIGIASTTVMAPTALEADLNATLLMLLGAEKGLAYLEQNQMTGIIVKSSGDVIMSKKALYLMEGSFT